MLFFKGWLESTSLWLSRKSLGRTRRVQVERGELDGRTGRWEKRSGNLERVAKSETSCWEVSPLKVGNVSLMKGREPLGPHACLGQGSQWLWENILAHSDDPWARNLPQWTRPHLSFRPVSQQPPGPPPSSCLQAAFPPVGPSGRPQPTNLFHTQSSEPLSCGS